MLGPVGERRPIARHLAQELLARADKLMYEAKGDRVNEQPSQIAPIRVKIEDGALVEIHPDEHPE
jgi:hypothetical protein